MRLTSILNWFDMLSDIKTIKKEFGTEIVWTEQDEYVGKCLRFEPGKKMGFRYNKTSKFSIYCIVGTIRVWTNTKVNAYTDVEPGSSFDILPKKIFRMEVPENQDYPTVLIEVGTNFENDLIIVEKT